MQSQPTWEDYNRLAEGQKRLEQEVKQLKEQHTEPMKVVLEQRPTEGETKLLETLLLQSGQQATAIGILQHDVSVLQRMSADNFMDIRKRFDAIAEVQKLILDRLPEKGGSE